MSYVGKKSVILVNLFKFYNIFVLLASYSLLHGRS